MAYLYFGEGAGAAAAGDAGMWPHTSYTGMQPTATTTALISFTPNDNTLVNDTVLVTYATTANGGGFKRFAEKFGKLLTQLDNKESKGMTVVADEDDSIYFDPIISGTTTITMVA